MASLESIGNFSACLEAYLRELLTNPVSFQLGLAWEGLTYALEIPAYFIPAPSRIWEAFWSNPGALMYNAGITLLEAMTKGSMLRASSRE